MSKNLIWSAEDLKKKGLVQNQSGDYVPVKSLVNTGKITKLPNLLERAQTPPKANQKVRNATKVVLPSGVKCDSKLEAYMHGLLTDAGLQFDFQKVFILQPGFRYRGKAIIAVKSICDFWLSDHNLLIDCKGFAVDKSILKYKILKYRFYLAHQSGKRKREPPEVIMPKNQTQCRELVARIKAGEFL